MSDVALCLPVFDLERMLTSARRHGHRVVATATSAAELVPRLADDVPHLVIAEASPSRLTAELVDACDMQGVALVAVTGTGGSTAHGARLGVADVVEAGADWALLGTPETGVVDETLHPADEPPAEWTVDAALAALEAADVVLAVGAADPIGLARLLRGHADLAQHVDPERVRVVVGKVRASAVGTDAAGQVRATLRRFGGVQDVALVPWDPAAFDAALLTARPLPVAAPRSSARAAVRRLAESLLPVAARPERRRRLFAAAGSH